MKKLIYIWLFLTLLTTLTANVLLLSKMDKAISSYNSHLIDLQKREPIEEIKCSYEELVALVKSNDRANKGFDLFQTKYSIKIISLYKQIVFITIVMLINLAVAIFVYIFNINKTSNKSLQRTC
ncbi:MAG: hypothetical protein KAI43_14185 [Candidatus Aureabacteria bacterium]|nr:hypothetical protein [Candidatus Auribacterota bacterium]